MNSNKVQELGFTIILESSIYMYGLKSFIAKIPGINPSINHFTCDELNHDIIFGIPGFINPEYLVVDIKSLEKIRGLLFPSKRKLNKNLQIFQDRIKATRVLLVEAAEKRILPYNLVYLRKSMNICGMLPIEMSQDLFNVYFDCIFKLDGKMLLIA